MRSGDRKGEKGMKRTRKLIAVLMCAVMVALSPMTVKAAPAVVAGGWYTLNVPVTQYVEIRLRETNAVFGNIKREGWLIGIKTTYTNAWGISEWFHGTVNYGYYKGYSVYIARNLVYDNQG